MYIHSSDSLDLRFLLFIHLTISPYLLPSTASCSYEPGARAYMANPMITAPPTTATTSFQTPLVALATPSCKLGPPPPPEDVPCWAALPVTAASTTVMEVWVWTLPLGRVKVDITVELNGEKKTELVVASTVVRAPAEPSVAVREKTTAPSEVLTGVADAGVERGTAMTVGLLVGVVRVSTGRMTPSDVDGDGVDRGAAEDSEADDSGSGTTLLEGGVPETVLLVACRLATCRSEVARGAFSEWTASRAVRSREKTPSWNLDDQRCRTEWMEGSSTSARRR